MSISGQNASTISSLPSTGKLEENVKLAIKAEQRHELINDTKIAAIGKTGSYDEFKALVTGAHLKPVNLQSNPLDQLANKSRKETEQGGSLQSIKQGFVSNFDLQFRLQSSELSESLLQANVQKPKSAFEFERDWGRHCTNSEQRYSYLSLLFPSELPQLFGKQFGLELLGQIVSVFAKELQPSSSSSSSSEQELGNNERQQHIYEHAFEFLKYLIDVKDFDMNVSFLSKAEQADAKLLFELLLQHAPSSPSLDVKQQTTEKASVSQQSSSSSSSSSSVSAAAASQQQQQSSSYPMLVPGWDSTMLNADSSSNGNSDTPHANMSLVTAPAVQPVTSTKQQQQRSSSLTSGLKFCRAAVKQVAAKYELSL